MRVDSTASTHGNHAFSNVDINMYIRARTYYSESSPAGGVHPFHLALQNDDPRLHRIRVVTIIGKSFAWFMRAAVLYGRWFMQKGVGFAQMYHRAVKMKPVYTLSEQNDESYRCQMKDPTIDRLVGFVVTQYIGNS